jgi:hypothetical protein
MAQKTETFVDIITARNIPKLLQNTDDNNKYVVKIPPYYLLDV